MIIQQNSINQCQNLQYHWQELLFKNCVSIRNGRDYKDIETNEGIPVIGSGGQFAYCSQTMYDGEVVFLGRKGTIDRPLYYNGPFWAVDTMFYAIPNKGFNGKFLYYLAICFPYKAISTQTALPSMTQTALKGLKVYIPEYDEQQRIVNYLDEKTKAIDGRISVLEKKSDAYTRLKASVINRAVTRGLTPNVPLKDSGIEWIGMIPEHWEVKRVKDNFSIKRGRVIPATELVDDGLYPVYSSQTENSGCMGFINTYDFDQKCLTWTTDGVNAGTVFLREGKFNCTNICGILVPIIKNIHLPFHYYSLYQTCKHNKRLDTNGAKIMSNEMAVIKYPIPPISEQQSIATYLDTKCSEIDKAKDNIGKQIDALKRLKRSLINEVVTGKRKI